MIASLPWMQWLTVPRRAGRPARRPARSPVAPYCHWMPPGGRGDPLPDEGRRRVVLDRVGLRASPSAPTTIRARSSSASPGRVEVADPRPDLADASNVSTCSTKPGRGRIVDAHRRRRRRRCTSRRRAKPVASWTWFFRSRWTTMTSLPTSSSHDRDPLADDPAVVGDDLEIEVRDEDAGVALARRRLADVAEAAPEREVAALDRVLELRPVDRLGDRVDERRVALELGELERRPERRHDRRHQVGQDVLGVVELGAGEEAGVAADVGDDEAGGLGLAEHGDGASAPSSAFASVSRAMRESRAGRVRWRPRLPSPGDLASAQRMVPVSRLQAADPRRPPAAVTRPPPASRSGCRRPSTWRPPPRPRRSARRRSRPERLLAIGR